MGANPIHYLVVPRFLGCLVLIPTLTIMADFMGVVGGCVLQHQVPGHRLAPLLGELAEVRGQLFDLFSGIFKSLFFGAAIALI